MIQKIKKSMILMLVFGMSMIVLPVCAENRVKQNNVVFMVDCSNSMNYNDYYNLTSKMVDLFTDTMYRDTKIGIVVFDDSIVKSMALTSVADARREIQQTVKNMARKGNTDIGFALNEAVSMMPQGQQNSIILFSDGETDLHGTKTARTIEHSYEYENKAYQKANETNTRIFTVALRKKGEADYLNKIASETNGKSYLLQETSQIPEIYQNICCEINDTIVNEVDKFTNSGNYKKQIPIKNDFADSSAIVIHTQNGIQNITTDCDDVTIIYSENYAVMDIKQQNDVVNIQFDMTNSDTIVIQTVHHINVFPQIEPFEKNTVLHLPVNVKLYEKATGKEVTNQKCYEHMTGELYVTDAETGEKQSIAMGSAGEVITANFENQNPKKYYFEANIKNGLYSSNTPIYEAELGNTKPYVLQKGQIKLFKKRGTQKIDLNEYFADDDGDKLTYQIQKKESTFEIDKNMVSVESDKEAIKQVALYVSDGRGGVIAEEITINIVPFWIYYKSEILKILFLFLLLFCIFIVIIRQYFQKQLFYDLFPVKKPFQNTVFEGYFLKTLSGNAIPILNWNTNYIDDKKSITLGEVFRILDVTEKLPEAHKIYFEMEKNGVLVFYHNTNCTVLCEKKNIAKKRKQILQYGNKLHIVFEDRVTEMELQYHIKQKRIYFDKGE